MDQNKDQIFKQKAIEAGHSPQEIDAFLASKVVKPETSGLDVSSLLNTGKNVVNFLNPQFIPGVQEGVNRQNQTKQQYQANPPSALEALNPLTIGKRFINENVAPGIPAVGEELKQLALGKLLGLVMNPIKSMGGYITNRLSQSPAMVDLGNVANRFLQERAPQFVKNMVGEESVNAYNKFLPKVEESATQQFPSFGEGGTQVPVNVANEIKKVIPRLGNVLTDPTAASGNTVSGAYGGTASPGLEVPKQFRDILSQEIGKVAPVDVNALHKIMSMLLGLQDTGTELFNKLPFNLGGIPKYVISGGANILKGAESKLPDMLSGNILSKLFGLENQSDQTQQ